MLLGAPASARVTAEKARLAEVRAHLRTALAPCLQGRTYLDRAELVLALQDALRAVLREDELARVGEIDHLIGECLDALFARGPEA